MVLTGYPTFRTAAEAVLDGTVDVALLPIENSTAGSINETYDQLSEGGLTINAEVVSQVEHCLLGLTGTRDRRPAHRDVASAGAAPVRAVPARAPLAQAAGRVRHRGRGAQGARVERPHAGGDRERVGGARVRPRGAGARRSRPSRATTPASSRWRARRRPVRPTSACKTSLVLVTAHKPGALGEVIVAFARRGVNLSKLESRPIPSRPFEYQFYLDIDGHAASEAITDTLREIQSQELTHELRILGTYPKATSRDRAGVRLSPGRDRARDDLARHDVAIVGGGIVGLASALTLRARVARPRRRARSGERHRPPSDRPQQRRHPLRSLLQAGLAQGARVRRRPARADRALRGARRRARDLRQAGGGDRARGDPAARRARAPRPGQWPGRPAPPARGRDPSSTSRTPSGSPGCGCRRPGSSTSSR